MNTRTYRIAIALAAAGMFASAAAAPALASGGGGGVTKTGHCTAHSTWKLNAKSDDGRIEVEGEVDSNVSGQHWTWRILHNGGVSARGSSTTAGASGSFSVQRRIVDGAGADHVGWRAHNGATGENCAGSLTI